jgi:uncharacterized protein YgbK (DUF1537 family)
VLTNGRSLDELAAVELTSSVARDLLEVAGDQGRRLQLMPRSDSTLRGHVIAEVDARGSVHPGYEGVLFVPAYL